MDITKVAEKYFNEPKAKGIAEALAKASAKVQISGTAGSGLALLGASTMRHAGGQHLIILPDKEEAAYFYNDLQKLEGEQFEVYFFPETARLPYHIESTDNANVVLRAEVLRSLSQNSNATRAIVCYPESLSEKVVTRKQLESHSFNVIRGQEYSLDFLNELLTDYAFERVDYVYEPGQFSIRGGILDVFSFGASEPYRIEFFGDEAESIRSFDPVSQLSTAKVESFSLVPNVQNKAMLDAREAFIDFMGPDTCVWYGDMGFITDRLERHFEIAEKQFEGLDSPLQHLPPKDLFLSASHFAERLKKHAQVRIGGNRGEELHFAFEQKPQPSFNKNFEMLSDALKANSENGRQNFIFSGNSKQTDRLRRIFKDLGKGVEFTAIDTELSAGFEDRALGICCYTDHQIFERYHRFYLKEGFKKNTEALTIKELNSLMPGDFVTHIDHGVGQFSGLEKIDVNGKEQEAIRLIYKGGDILYVSIHSLHRISKYSGKDGTEPTVHKLGSAAWQKAKAKTKSRVKKVAYDLIKLYAERKSKKGFAFSPDNYLQTELEASFIYEDTPDQMKATQAVKEDMEAEYPMDRLVCGDVGFGKTEVAIRAAFKAVCDSKQVAVLVPTTILSLQHFKNFKERLRDFPCNVAYINRFVPAAKQRKVMAELAEGHVDIIIGTHRLVNKDIRFQDLGLLVIDEEQKFGVSVKDKLKTLKANVDTLTLTATPIPRTLQFSLMGARDLSIINTPPPNRFPVQTELYTFNEELVRDAISYEVERGGQVFFVNNKIGNIVDVAGMIQRLCPGVKVAIGHGQMDGKKLEEVMTDFIDGLFDVLVATTIIESGIDIPNANTIIINSAHEFGLSDLHQLRGRVGRSNKKAFCYLFAPPLSVVSAEARKRLQAITQFSDLGSGLNIAMRDLDIRGAGNLLGGEQSGFINELGFETYQKILDEAIQELKEDAFKELYKDEVDKAGSYVSDCQLETDLEILIPDHYVSEISERLKIYREIDDLQSEVQLEAYKIALRDRFGSIPAPTLQLLDAVKLRWLAREVGFEKLTLKSERLIGFFVSRQDSPYYQSEAFTAVLDFFKSNPAGYKMYEKNGQLRLSVAGIKSISLAIKALNPLIESRHAPA